MELFLIVVVAVLILFHLHSLRKSTDTLIQRLGASAQAPPSAIRPEELNALRSRLNDVQSAVTSIQSHLAEMRKDHEILDELEENVMHEWAKVIEDKLGKRPIFVACPKCGHEGGLEPNLLTEDDSEYGCPNCGSILSVELLRETYPDAVI